MEDRVDEATRIIQELDAARAAMRAVWVKIDPAREIYGGWTIKHILAHIAGWDEAVIASLQAHLGRQEPGSPAVQGIDAYNAASVARRQALSLAEVEREWELTRAQMKELVAAMSPERLGETLPIPWGGRGTVAEMVQGLGEHEHEHAAELEGLLRRA